MWTFLSFKWSLCLFQHARSHGDTTLLDSAEEEDRVPFFGVEDRISEEDECLVEEAQAEDESLVEEEDDEIVGDDSIMREEETRNDPPQDDV